MLPSACLKKKKKKIYIYIYVNEIKIESKFNNKKITSYPVIIRDGACKTSPS